MWAGGLTDMSVRSSPPLEYRMSEISTRLHQYVLTDEMNDIVYDTYKEASIPLSRSNSLMHIIQSSILSTLSSQRVIEISTYISFLSIVVIRIAVGSFPATTKWFAFFGALGLLLLWLKHKTQSTRRYPSTRNPSLSTTKEQLWRLSQIY